MGRIKEKKEGKKMRSTTDKHNIDSILTGNQSWREQALCRGMDVNLFFPKRGLSVHHDSYKTVQTTCAACPVRQQCLDFAMAIEHGNSAPRCGFYGGLSANARYELAKTWEPPLRVA